MESNDFIFNITEQLRKETKTAKLDIRFFLNEAVSKKVPLQVIPKNVRDTIDGIASQVLDPENNRTIVTGHQFTGKSFLIEQFAYNVDFYLQNSKLDTIHFISISDIEMVEFGNRKNLLDYVEAIKKELQINDENICFVTESPEVALYVSNVVGKAKVILEIGCVLLNKILHAGSQSTSKMFVSWVIVNVNSVQLTQKDLVDWMWNSAAKRFNQEFKIELTKRQIQSFIQFTIKQMPDIVHEYDDLGEYILVPPGIWATAIRKLYTMVNFNSETDKTSLKDFFIRTLDELANYFDGDDDDDEHYEIHGAPEEVAQIIQAIMAGKEVSANGGVEKSPVTPFEFNEVRTLEDRIKTTIIGQDDAVHKLSENLLIPAAKLNDPNKPLRSFLFLGPTGVGKTQLALDLAKQVSTGPINVVRIDMSEYQKEHDVAKLFGSPPGYIGHGEGGQLTSAVAENPHSIVLLDEIEKADSRVWDTFLQVLDSGRLTDSRGMTVDFSQTIIIMTSNIGINEAKRIKTGFKTGTDNEQYEIRQKEMNGIVMKEMEKIFRPEFINRIDEILIFKELTVEMAREIVLREINNVSERMVSTGFSLNAPSDDVINTILEQSDIAKYGAREIQRVVYKNVSSKIAQNMLSDEKPGKLTLKSLNNEIFISSANERRKNVTH